MREFALPEDMIIDAVAGLSEQDAIAVIISATSAMITIRPSLGCCPDD